VELNRRYLESGHVRHAYALTGHAAQGLTVERAFVLGAGEARLQEWGYVALSRAREATRLYVTGIAREHESDFHILDDPDALTRFGRALEESSIERLALDQRALPSSYRARPHIERTALTPEARLHLRLLEQRRRALEKTRDTAQRRLGAAQRELERRSLLRRRHRDQLRAEIERQRSAVGVADSRLTEAVASLQDARHQLSAVDHAPRPPVSRSRADVSRSTQSREAPALVLER
jgi:hypothetical protein